MDILQEIKDNNRKSFISHVFSTTEEGKAELLNVVQYAVLGIIPIVVLNKLVQRFIPEADPDKSSLELSVEIMLQLMIMFCGIILIHRIISYIPTYSGFKYENLALTHVMLAFLVIILSIQTKLGIKVNMLVDRVFELWNGPSPSGNTNKNRPNGSHNASKADFYDSPRLSPDMFIQPASLKPSQTAPPPQASAASSSMMNFSGPVAANSALGGGAFGAYF
jgi:hypothetical protein